MVFSPEQIAEWSARGFEVKADGCLAAYTGMNPHVEIPEGVTKSGDWAFWRCLSSQGEDYSEHCKKPWNRSIQ
jgi:hypothetical protein